MLSAPGFLWWGHQKLKSSLPLQINKNKLERKKVGVILHNAFTIITTTLGKSEQVTVGDVVGIDKLVEILACKIGALPISNLGLPLGSFHNVECNFRKDGEEVGGKEEVIPL